MKRIVTQMKRTLSLVLAAMMVLTAVPQSVDTVYGAEISTLEEPSIEFAAEDIQAPVEENVEIVDETVSTEDEGDGDIDENDALITEDELIDAEESEEELVMDSEYRLPKPLEDSILPTSLKQNNIWAKITLNKDALDNVELNENEDIYLIARIASDVPLYANDEKSEDGKYWMWDGRWIRSKETKSPESIDVDYSIWSRGYFESMFKEPITEGTIVTIAYQYQIIEDHDGKRGDHGINFTDDKGIEYSSRESKEVTVTPNYLYVYKNGGTWADGYEGTDPRAFALIDHSRGEERYGYSFNKLPEGYDSLEELLVKDGAKADIRYTKNENINVEPSQFGPNWGEYEGKARLYLNPYYCVDGNENWYVTPKWYDRQTVKIVPGAGAKFKFGDVTTVSNTKEFYFDGTSLYPVNPDEEAEFEVLVKNDWMCNDANFYMEGPDGKESWWFCVCNEDGTIADKFEKFRFERSYYDKYEELIAAGKLYITPYWKTPVPNMNDVTEYNFLNLYNNKVDVEAKLDDYTVESFVNNELEVGEKLIFIMATPSKDAEGNGVIEDYKLSVSAGPMGGRSPYVVVGEKTETGAVINKNSRGKYYINITAAYENGTLFANPDKDDNQYSGNGKILPTYGFAVVKFNDEKTDYEEITHGTFAAPGAQDQSGWLRVSNPTSNYRNYSVILEEYEDTYQSARIFPVTVKSGNATVTKKNSAGTSLVWNYNSTSDKGFEFVVSKYSGAGSDTFMPNPDEVYYSVGESSVQNKISCDSNGVYIIPKDAITDTVHIYVYRYALASVRSAYKDGELDVQVKSSIDSKFYSDGELHMVGTSQSNELTYRFINDKGMPASDDVEVYAVKPGALAVEAPITDVNLIEKIKGLDSADYKKLDVRENNGEYTFKVPIEVPNGWKKNFNIFVIYGTKRSTLRVFKDDSEADISVKYGSKSQKLTKVGDVQPYYCIGDVGEVTTVTVTPKANCTISWVKVAEATDEASVDWNNITPVKMDVTKGGTFDVKLNKDTIINVRTTRNIVITSINGIADGKTVPYTAKNGYSVDKGKTYKVNAMFGPDNLDLSKGNLRWTEIVDPSGILTETDDFSTTGLFTVKSDADIKPGKYVITLKNAVSEEEVKEYPITLNILPSIDKISISAVKNGVLSQIADTEVTYPLAITSASATNTLAVYANKALISDGSVKIPDDMKTITIKTGAVPTAEGPDGTVIKIVNKENPEVSFSFKLKAVKPSQFKAPKLAVTSDHTGYDITVTNDKSLKKPVAGCYAYNVKLTYTLDGTEMTKDVPLKVVSFDSNGVPEKTAGPIRVNILGEEDNEKVKSKIEVSLVKLDLASSDADEKMYSAMVETGHVVQTGKTATAASETLYRAYETKLSLTKKQSTIYTGQEDIVIAVPKFSKTTSYRSLANVKVTNKSGIEIDGALISATINEQTNEICVTAGSTAEAGKYYVVAEAVAEDGMIPSSAKLEFTVKAGTIGYSVKVPTTRLFKPAKSKATLKATVVYPSGVKGKVTWSMLPVDENGEYSAQTQEAIDAKLISMKNGTVTVDKNYSQPAEGYDYIKLKVEGPNYKNEVVSAESDIIKIDADSLQFLAPIVSGNGADTGSPVLAGTKGYSIVVKTKGGETVDPSLYTLKISAPKAFKLEVDGTYSAISATNNVKITATANDGSKFSTQKLFNIKNLTVYENTPFGINIGGTTSSKKLESGILNTLDTVTFTPADYISIEPAVNYLTGDDIKNYSIKVEVKDAEKITAGGKTYYRFKVDGTALKPIKVTITDTSAKAYKNEPRVSKTFIIKSNYEVKTAKISAKQNTTKKLYAGTYAGQQDVRIDITDSANLFADTAVNKLWVIKNDPKSDEIYYSISEESKVLAVEKDSAGKKYVTLKFKSDAELVKGKYNLALVARNGEDEDVSSFATLQLNVEKQTPAIGKYSPMSKITLTYEGIGEGYPESELIATYSKAKGEDIASHPAVTNYLGLVDDTINGRTNGFTDYFVLSGNSLKVKEVEGVPAWKVIIPKTALTGYVKYSAKYGTNVDGTYAVDPEMTEIKYAKITVILNKSDAFYTYENAINMINTYFKTFEVSEKAYKSGNMKTIESEIKSAISSALGDSAKKYTIVYDTSSDCHGVHFTTYVEAPTLTKQGELRSYFSIKGKGDESACPYKTSEDVEGLVVKVSKVNNQTFSEAVMVLDEFTVNYGELLGVSKWQYITKGLDTPTEQVVIDRLQEQIDSRHYKVVACEHAEHIGSEAAFRYDEYNGIDFKFHILDLTRTGDDGKPINENDVMNDVMGDFYPGFMHLWSYQKKTNTVVVSMPSECSITGVTRVENATNYNFDIPMTGTGDAEIKIDYPSVGATVSGVYLWWYEDGHSQILRLTEKSVGSKIYVVSEDDIENKLNNAGQIQMGVYLNYENTRVTFSGMCSTAPDEVNGTSHYLHAAGYDVDNLVVNGTEIKTLPDEPISQLEGVSVTIDGTTDFVAVFDEPCSFKTQAEIKSRIKMAYVTLCNEVKVLDTNVEIIGKRVKVTVKKEELQKNLGKGVNELMIVDYMEGGH